MKNVHSILNGARYVRIDPETDLMYVWHGGHTVNMYRVSGASEDCFNIGDYEVGSVTFNYAKARIDARVDRNSEGLTLVEWGAAATYCPREDAAEEWAKGVDPTEYGSKA